MVYGSTRGYGSGGMLSIGGGYGKERCNMEAGIYGGYGSFSNNTRDENEVKMLLITLIAMLVWCFRDSTTFVACMLCGT